MRLENGPRQTDGYGRLLAYVYTEDAESIAEKLIQEGLGEVWTHDGQHRDPWMSELDLSGEVAFLLRWRQMRPVCSAGYY